MTLDAVTDASAAIAMNAKVVPQSTVKSPPTGLPHLYSNVVPVAMKEGLAGLVEPKIRDPPNVESELLGPKDHRPIYAFELDA